MKQTVETGTINRRRFMAATAAVSGVVFSEAMPAAAAAEKTGEKLNVALAGTGTQGMRLLEVCMQIPDVRVQAVCDIWRKFSLMRAGRTLKQYKQTYTAYSGFGEMIDTERDLDAVLIATPDFCHAEQACAALEAGLSVYCESPMSDTVEGAAAMARAAAQSKGVLQVGFQRRSNPVYRHCCYKLLGEVGLLGRITTINGQWNRPVETSRGWPRRYSLTEAELNKHGYESMRQFRNWRWMRGMGGGPLASYGSHQLDVYNWFLGTMPESVTASGGTDYYSEKTHQWPDTVQALLRYKTRKGVVRAFYQVISTNSNMGDYEKMLGDKGSMSISEDPLRASLYREKSVMDWDRWVNLEYLKRPDEEKKKEADAGPALDVTDSRKPTEYLVPVSFTGSVYKPHLENFFDAVRGRAQPACPAEEGYKTACLVAAVNHAVEKKAEQKFTYERL